MSSSTPTFSVPIPAPTDEDNDNGGNGGVQRGASYFFGFLITFVVLLIAFVGCGLVSRRRFTARRRAIFERTMEPWAERRYGGQVEYIPPVLVDKESICLQDTSWKDLFPLSAMIISAEKGQGKGSRKNAASVPAHRRSTTAQSPTTYDSHGARFVDPGLDIVTRTLSSTSRRHSEDPSRVTSHGSGPIRITSATPYYRNPNVLMAYGEVEDIGIEWEQQRQRLEREGQLRSHWHWAKLCAWFRRIIRCRRRRQTQEDSDTENGGQDVVYGEKRKDGVDQHRMLQIAVVISMPSPSLPSTSGDCRVQASPTLEYEIGVMHSPCQWDDDNLKR